MDFTIDSTTGTAQQVAWVNQAIQQCAYPIKYVNVPVKVTWGNGPCTAQHTYMCTEWEDDGFGNLSFTIYIEPWADDPNNINNRGLPNPAQDIQDFYKQSFVHELGHVVQDTLLNTDDLRTKASALFWTLEINSASGRRIGTLPDYSPTETTGISWADSIQETIAESFKAAWYTGRLVYLNRTNWRIDEQEWPTLVQLLAPLAEPAINDFTEKFDEDPRTFPPNAGMPFGYTNFEGPGLLLSWANGELDVGSNPPTLQDRFVIGSNVTAGLPGPPPLFTAVKVMDITLPATYSAKAVVGFGGDGLQGYLAGLRKDDSGLHLGVNLGEWDGWIDGQAWPEEAPVSLALPLWLGLRMSPGAIQAELWQTDPLLGGTPTLVLPWTGASPGSPIDLRALLAFAQLDSVAGFEGQFTDWSYPVVGAPIVPPPLTAPYPYAAQAGAIVTGPGSRGTLALSV